MPAIYLDNNATTALDPRAAERMMQCFQSGALNPASQHAVGRRARQQLDEAVETIGHCIGTRLDQPGGARLLITSGGTESNNLAISGIGTGPIVISRMEHSSVMAAAEAQRAAGRSIRYLDVDEQGEIRLDQLNDLLWDMDGPASLVSIMSANNETGVVQPILEAAAICRAAGVPLHVDATQSIGKLPLALDALGASAVTLTAHKFHGPVGVGALWIAPGMKVRPLLVGGQQQLETRAGTEPLALVVGMAEALHVACRELAEANCRIAGLRDRLEGELMRRHAQLVIQGSGKTRLPGTTAISFIGTDRQSMLMALDLAGICCSSGSACSSGSSPPSQVLRAMGRPEEEVQSTLRFGISKFSTAAEIDRAIDCISSIYIRLRR